MLFCIMDLSAEIVFQTARSGGKGGQNVNKVETMVEGRWKIADSVLVTGEQKQLLFEKLKTKITGDGFLLMKSQSDRTQLGNKELVVTKINKLVEAALKQQKKRKPSKIPKAIKEKRIEGKKQKAEIKKGRKKMRPGDF